MRKLAHFLYRLTLATLFMSLIGFAARASAMPIRVTTEQLLRDSAPQQRQFVPARVGWNDDVSAHSQVNPAYQKIMFPETPEGVRRQWQQLLRPRWEVMLALAALIGCLRVLRARDERRRVAAPAHVLAFPIDDERALEAA